MAETEPSQTASYSWRPNSTHETEVLHPSRWDVWTPNQVPTFPFKPGFPSDFAISVSSTWILPRIEPEIHSWCLPWLAPPPSPLVWTLKQLLSVSTTWQFILINTALVKWLKGKCIYSLPSQRLGTPYGKGWGLSFCWMPHEADLQKLQRYLFIKFNQQTLGEPPLWTQRPAPALGSLGLSKPSLHQGKGWRVPREFCFCRSNIFTRPFKMNRKLRLISPQKGGLCICPSLPRKRRRRGTLDVKGI